MYSLLFRVNAYRNEAVFIRVISHGSSTVTNITLCSDNSDNIDPVNRTEVKVSTSALPVR